MKTPPANWHVSNSTYHSLIIDDSDGRTVAVSYEKKDGPLLAVAPEALAACQAAEEYLFEIDSMNPEKPRGELGRKIRRQLQSVVENYNHFNENVSRQ